MIAADNLFIILVFSLCEGVRLITRYNLYVKLLLILVYINFKLLLTLIIKLSDLLI